LVSLSPTAVLGTAFAFNILLGIPVWAGVVLTVLSTLLLLGVERFGVRRDPNPTYCCSHSMAWPWLGRRLSF
jgi:hypothetical protein